MRWPSWRRWLAGSAVLAGALAPLVGSPYRRASDDRGAARARAAAGAPDTTEATSTTGVAGVAAPAIIDVAELARVVADQDDHISAVQLAAWIRAGKRHLRVIDVRSATEFAAYHIPGAEHVPLESLAAASFSHDDTLVLYSEAGVHAAQAWVFLRALGHRRVFFLRNGLHEWLDDVMSPTIADDAPADAQAAFERVAELSRWFGGLPRRLPGEVATPSHDALRARRRGC